MYLQRIVHAPWTETIKVQQRLLSGFKAKESLSSPVLFSTPNVELCVDAVSRNCKTLPQKVLRNSSY